MPPFSFCSGFLLICLVVLHAHFQNLSSAASSSSFIHFSPGFNVSLLPSYSLPSGHPVSYDRMFAVAIPNVDGGIFFPILSSPFFNSSEAPGYSFGFYAAPCDSVVCTLYLAVCVGYSGSTTPNALLSGQFFPASPGVNLYPYYPVNGVVAPQWLANEDKPIKNAGDASLVVVATSSGASNEVVQQELQLRDGNRVVWNVSNADMMEMSDSGDFRIYDSQNMSVFQARSTIVNNLLEGQRMTVGMELTSPNAAYTARMEKGGLALFLNSMGSQALPYWIFPLLRSDPNSTSSPPASSSQTSPGNNMHELIFSAPCRNASYTGYLQVVSGNSGVSLGFSVEPESCSSSFSDQYFYYYPIKSDNATLAWSFLRLEDDGRLYIVGVMKSFPYPALIIPVDLKDPALRTFIRLPHSARSVEVAKPTSMIANNSILQISHGGPILPFCDVPLACGPLGVCKPASISQTPCVCPDESLFVSINTTDPRQGCQPRTNLPLCNAGASSAQSKNFTFMELKSTASVFFFNEWPLNSTKDVDACKHACASDCACLGISYQVSTSSCFLIQHNISLVSVLDSNITIWNYTATSIKDVPLTKQVYADDYVTHLKVAKSPPAPPGPPERKDLGTNTTAQSSNPFPLMSLIGIIPLCVFFVGLGAYHAMKRRRRILQQAKEEEELQDILPILPSRFTYKQLKEATQGFSKLLGAGGCSSVYEGILLDGRRVAVKVLEGVLQGARQTKQFLTEVAIVGRTGHQNIVRLVGFCWQASHRILVYEFVERGSLDRWLFAVEGDTSLEWPKRYDIALGIARGLQYLHDGCEQSILHFDIKPQNILLDDAFVAKIADFGMSRLMERDMSSVMTRLRGTPGYIAPEWLSHATVSKKCDVYSMGMVMLEIVAGRRVLDYSLLSSKSSTGMESAEQEAWHLPSWAAKKMEQELLMEIVDKRLDAGSFDEMQVHRLIYIAFWCIHDDPAVRPTAATVVQWLENMDLPIQPPPVTTTMNSRLREQHAQVDFTSV